MYLRYASCVRHGHDVMPRESQLVTGIVSCHDATPMKVGYFIEGHPILFKDSVLWEILISSATRAHYSLNQGSLRWNGRFYSLSDIRLHRYISEIRTFKQILLSSLQPRRWPKWPSRCCQLGDLPPKNGYVHTGQCFCCRHWSSKSCSDHSHLQICCEYNIIGESSWFHEGMIHTHMTVCEIAHRHTSMKITPVGITSHVMYMSWVISVISQGGQIRDVL